eukprot:4110799-Amphidinium_carterae.1
MFQCSADIFVTILKCDTLARDRSGCNAHDEITTTKDDERKAIKARTQEPKRQSPQSTSVVLASLLAMRSCGAVFMTASSKSDSLMS